MYIGRITDQSNWSGPCEAGLGIQRLWVQTPVGTLDWNLFSPPNTAQSSSTSYGLRTTSESEMLLVTCPNDIEFHSPGPVIREVSPKPLQEK